MIRSTPTLIIPPVNEPVTLDDIKVYARIDSSDEDALIATLISSAREAAEKHMRRALMTQTWRLTVDLPCDGWGNALPAGTYNLPISVLSGDLPDEFDLPYAPLQSITSVTTFNTANASAVYAASNYFADTSNSRLVLNNTAVWPSSLRTKATVQILYVCGYGTSANVPALIKTAIKMHVQKMYDDRLICEIPSMSMAIYNQYKVYG